MNWIFLALLAPFIYAINVFLDKYLIEARLPNYRSLPIFSSILAAIFIGILFLSSSVNLLSLRDSFLIITTGILTVWAFSLYLEALIKEEGSIIILLIQLVPIIVLALSYLFLGETINLKQFIGFVLLFFSSILASFKKNNTSFKFSAALIYILLANVLWAIPYIFIKIASSSISFPNLVMYESIGIVIGGILLYLFINPIRKAFLKTVKSVKRPVLGLIFLNECLFLLGKILTYLALTLGPAALISILGSTQIFFGVLLGTALTLVLPKVFKEDLSKGGLMKKAFLGVLAFIGIILLS